jgi:hypothetical protein
LKQKINQSVKNTDINYILKEFAICINKGWEPGPDVNKIMELYEVWYGKYGENDNRLFSKKYLDSLTEQADWYANGDLSSPEFKVLYQKHMKLQEELRLRNKIMERYIEMLEEDKESYEITKSSKDAKNSKYDDLDILRAL